MVPHLPVIFVVTVVDDVPGEAEERRIRFSNRVHQGDSHRGVGGFGVFGIVKAGVAVGNKAERRLYIEMQINRSRSLDGRILRAASEKDQGRKSDHDEWQRLTHEPHFRKAFSRRTHCPTTGTSNWHSLRGEDRKSVV